MTLTEKTKIASKWSVLAEVFSKAITPLVFLLLARFLVPEEFGIVAISMIIVSFAQVICDAGMNNALVQSAIEFEANANEAFWVNMVLGGVLLILLLLLADYLAVPFGDPRVADVIRLQGLQLLIFPLISVQTARFQKNLEFKPLFKVQAVTAFVSGAVSISLATQGMSYWALVWGPLIASFSQAIFLWKLSAWSPGFHFSYGEAVQLLKFGGWITGEKIIGWFYTWGDSLVIGLFLASTFVGLYRTGSNLVLMLFGVLLAPVQSVLLSALSRLQNDPSRLGYALSKASRAIALVCLPLGAGIFVLRNEVVGLVFDSSWQDIGPVIGWTALTQALAWTVGLNSTACKAVGRPDVTFKLNLLLLTLYVPVYVFSIQYGLETFLQARLALTLVAIPAHIVIVRRLFGGQYRQYFDQIGWGLTGSFAAAVSVVLISRLFTHNSLILELMVTSLLGLLVYLLVIKNEWSFLKSLISPGTTIKN